MRRNRKQYYMQDEVDYLYDELLPTIEAHHLSISSGYALAAALKKHAREIIEMEDSIMDEEEAGDDLE